MASPVMYEATGLVSMEQQGWWEPWLAGECIPNQKASALILQNIILFNKTDFQLDSTSIGFSLPQIF